MAKLIITKTDNSDDTDVDFATSDDNLDLIVRELDMVTEFLERDELKAKNRDHKNELQREWRGKNPEKVQEYNARRDKVATRKRARELYQINRDKELERQRIIREKRRATKLAQQNAPSTDVSAKIKQGTQKIKKTAINPIDIIKKKGDMEF